MKKKDITAIIEKLLADIEEEDIGISLFSTFYQNQDELCFFTAEDRDKVLKILKILSDDSRGHKEILGRIIQSLEGEGHEE